MLKLNSLFKFPFIVMITIFACNYTQVVLADETELLLKLEGNLKIYKPYNCDNLVNDVRIDSRRYLEIDGYSIEQIEKRAVIDENDSSIKCKGTAVLSNTSTLDIQYGAFIDNEDEWMIEYSLQR